MFAKRPCTFCFFLAKRRNVSLLVLTQSHRYISHRDTGFSHTESQSLTEFLSYYSANIVRHNKISSVHHSVASVSLCEKNLRLCVRIKTVRSPCTRLFPVRSVPPSVPQSLCESPLPKYCSFSYAFTFYLFTFLPFYFLKGRFAQNYKKICFKIVRPAARNYFLTCNSHVINHEFFYNFLIQFFCNFEAVRPTRL